jgi:serine/threonine protein phosphatase PrpC
MSSNSAAIETAAEKNEKETLPRLANIRHNDVPHSTNFNYTTLTGTYTLYNVNINQHDGQRQQQILGIIHYPIADLSTLLIEEASSVDYIGRLIMTTMQFQQQQQQQQQQLTSLLQPFPSLLSDTSFHSVISTTPDVNNHNNKDEDDASANIWSSITRKGYKPGNLPNQDRSIIAHLALYDTTDDNNNHYHPTSLLVGIFDGHGTRGHEVSHHCAFAFPRVLSRIIGEKQQQHQQAGSGGTNNNNVITTTTSYIKDALLETFVEVDATEPVKGSAGSTAALLFYPGTGTNIYIANTGDSTIIICTYNKSTKTTNIIYQNRKHKPHLVDERRRIESLGGRVMIPPSLEVGLMNDNTNDKEEDSMIMKESSRVIIPGSHGNQLALAMSRSIGDYDGKRVGITAIPEIDVLDITSHHVVEQEQVGIEDTQFFVIAASDGLYDVIPQHIVTSFISRSLFHLDSNNKEGEEEESVSSPLVACERLVREASRLWIQAESGMNQYRDDITVSVSIIDVHIGEEDDQVRGR